MKDQSVAVQLAKKMKLEDRLKPKLSRFFNQIGRDVKTVWLSTRSIPSLQSFRSELIFLLREHYRAVNRVFKRTSRDNLKCIFLNLERKQEEDIDRNIINFINTHSQAQSDLILNTTQRDLQNIADKIILDVASEGTILTTREIGNSIQKDFATLSKGRIPTIAMTETQTSSETIKFLEATGLAVIFSQTPGTQELFKTWNTVLDERTRLSHVEADRQRVRVNEPFRVQGQNLMMPGDTSLGATPDNVINCRCTAIFNLEGEESPPLDIPRQLL